MLRKIGLVLIGIILLWGTAVVSAEKIKVLHVSVVMQNEVQQTIDVAGAADNFTVTQVSLGDFNAGVSANLIEYDVVVFGISDGYEEFASYGLISRTSELKEYVANGGGIVFTHDSLEFENDYPELEEIAGVDYVGASWISNTEVKIVQEHEVLHNLFEIGDVGYLIPVDATHTTGGQITTASPIIRFSNAGEEPDNFYLTIYKYGNGRVVVNEIGHSYIGKIAGIEESRIFCNSLYWAGGGTGPEPPPYCDLTPILDVLNEVNSKLDILDEINIKITNLETKLNELIIIKPSVTSFQINNGASSTMKRKVTLNNTATNTPTHYMASESSSFSGASWLTYSTSPSFTLSSAKGTKTVYFKVKNSTGESSTVSDTITLK